MKYTKETVKTICQNIEMGMNQRHAAAVAGINEATFYEWMKKDEFSKAVKAANMKATQFHVANIRKAANSGLWTASAWWLERHHPDLYALRQILTHTTPPGQPMQVDLTPTLKGLSVETLRKLIKACEGERNG